MTEAEYLRLLPEKAGEHILTYAKNELMDELGEDMIVFKSELIKRSPEYIDFLVDENNAKGKAERVASCTCTACGETFYCGWLPSENRKKYGISIIQGEDGNFYTGIPSGDYSVDCLEGDQIECPLCGTYNVLVHSSRLNKGKVFQVGVSEIQNLGNLTAIITWLVKRTVHRNGRSPMEVLPYGAVILDGKKLISFKHFQAGMFGHTYYIEEWYKNRRFSDPTDNCYYDSASFNGKKKGAAIYPNIPDLTGASGEKTGLAKYIEAGGTYPAEYLAEWKKHPAIENFLYTGWEHLVLDLIRKRKVFYYGEGFLNCCWSRKKPHEILAMSKTDYKALALKRWSISKTNIWLQCVENKLPITATEFEKQNESFVDAFIRSIINKEVTASEFHHIDRYIKKQQYPSSVAAFDYLVDHWRMLSNRLEAEGIERPLTHEERFPRNIMQAHEQDLKFIQASKDKELQKKFDSVFNAYHPIEWTDGELCILLPLTEKELIKEGQVLRHCVGSYGKAHAEGKKIILFVRHSRRPERSYYTLNIDFSGNEPREIQLHGYGNERHGKNKEYSHTIPKKVRKFVDKWEQEVLIPWALKQQKNKETKKSA